MNRFDVALERMHEGRDWCKRRYGHFMQNQGPVCMSAAFFYARRKEGNSYWAMTTAETMLLWRVIRERFPERVAHLPAHAAITAVFNDHKDTEWPDVESVMVEASEIWKREHDD